MSFKTSSSSTADTNIHWNDGYYKIRQGVFGPILGVGALVYVGGRYALNRRSARMVPRMHPVHALAWFAACLGATLATVETQIYPVPPPSK